ncbi:hypothetical protein BDN67DRAFT_970157 [Paxillus ammoniavirescens]|nr:hypothetical protein BDN67DRAFT_970157 [Paxillus ammoniavirescens]
MYPIVLIGLLQRMRRELTHPCRGGGCRLADFLVHLRPVEEPDLITTADRIKDHQPVGESTGSSSIGIESYSPLQPLPPSLVSFKKPFSTNYLEKLRIEGRTGWKSTAGPKLKGAKEEMVPADFIRESKEMRDKVEKREGFLPFAASRMRRRRQSARGVREITFGF